ncbi:MAG: insulinase family protein [Parvibaculum sp.]|nr:insulinase family protein [Parvibaculum sp.]
MKIERVVSPGGIEAWLVEEYEVPVIVMNVAWAGGSASDPAGKPGLANMVSGLLDEGAGDMDSETYQKRLEASNAVLSYSDDRDYFNARLKTLAENRDEAFALLQVALASPRFDPPAVERIRAQLFSIAARNTQDPEWIASQAWFKAAYGDHPYARPSEGTLKSIAAIKRADLVTYTKRTFARDNMKIGVVGPLKPAELGLLLDKTFGALPAHARLAHVPDVKMAAKSKTVIVKKPFPQSVVIFGSEGMKRADPDFIPAYVMNYVLGGGGFSSRLTEEVREKRGLAYSVGTYLYPMRHAAMLLGDVGTKNASVGVSLSLIRKEFARMAADGVTDKELDDAKTFLTGSYPLRFDSNGQIAGELVAIQQENLGIDYVDRRNGLVEAVTKADIARTAKRLLDAKPLIVTVVGEPNMTQILPPGTAEPMPAPPTGPSEGGH